MNGQTTAGNPRRPPGQHLPGLGFQLAATATIIGHAPQEASALPPWPSCTRNPFLQDVMEAYRGQPG